MIHDMYDIEVAKYMHYIYNAVVATSRKLKMFLTTTLVIQ